MKIYGRKICAGSIAIMCMAIIIISCRNVPEDMVNENIYLEIVPSSSNSVILDHGVQYDISKQEESRLLDSNEKLVQKEIAPLKLSNGMDFSLDSASLTFDQGSRVSAIYNGADSIGADDGFSVTYEAYVICEKDFENKIERELLSFLADQYDLSNSGISAVSDQAFLYTGKGNYQAMIFNPRIYVFQGKINCGSEKYSVEIHFPCVNVLGCLDGLYSIYTTDCPDEIPDVQ